MDKDILNYLDKVGQYIQGASEKGFETYVHGVFVESIIKSLIGLVLIIASIYLIKLLIIHWEKISDKNFEPIVIFPLMFLVIGGILLSFGLVGIFAPDYVAIKEIVKGISNK